MVTKSITTKPAVKPVRKPRVVKKPEVEPKPSVHEVVPHAQKLVTEEEKKPKHEAGGKYIFATGRRKTSVANIRLFTGTGKHLVNKKPFDTYFSFSFYNDKVLQPFQITGLGKNYYFVAHVNGGGIHSQAEAVRHGIARALSGVSEEVKNLLKKNGFLTRDDRKKERKKPGLKRARRAPQWAKR